MAQFVHVADQSLAGASEQRKCAVQVLQQDVQLEDSTGAGMHCLKRQAHFTSQRSTIAARFPHAVIARVLC